MKIYQNEDGTTTTLSDILEEKNARLFEELDGKSEEIVNTSSTKKGRMRMGARLTACLYAYFAKQPIMSREDYVDLDAEDLGCYFSYYLDMLSHYDIFEIPHTRQLLSAYMGITVSKFTDLMRSNDLDLREKAIFINDSIDGMVFAQAESSNNNATATLVRGKIKDSGQGMVQQADEVVLSVGKQINPELLIQQAEAIVANAQKKLGGGRK